MNIPSSKYLRNKARNRLETGREPKKVILVYAGISLAMAFLVTAVRYALAAQISHTGGLQNIGIRSVLSTMDTVLPILQALLIMCLDLGYIAAMLRIGRRQYASPKTLKAGAERFWPLLRKNLLLGIYYAGIGIISFYASLALYVATPLSQRFKDLAMPMLLESNYNPDVFLNNPEAIDQLLPTMLPLFIIYFLLLAAGLIWVYYRYRMADYLLIDNPGMPATLSLRVSRFLMRGNFLAMLKLDLSFWWFYLLQLLASALAYLDLILAQFGIILPVPEAVSFLGTFLVYLLADFAILYFFKNKVALTYALAYDSLIPHEKKDDGVVLGNIFQM